MPEKTFNKVFGRKKMDELRKKRVSKKKAATKTARQIADTGKKAPPEPEKPAPKRTYKDFIRGLG